MSIQSPNDIIIVTGWARVIHFNGITWDIENSVFNQFGPGQISCKTMDRNGQMIALVGSLYGGMHAYVATGNF
jgi:hypothetical protein